MLYFFAVIMWTSLIPFSPTLVSRVENKTVSDLEINVLYKDGSIRKMTLDEYVLGVMLTEMPSNYEKQALKAQAVAIRSYALYLMENSVTKHHPEADLCADGNCCRKYITYDELCEISGDKNADLRLAIMSTAVKETQGEVLTYNGKTAMTLYHISSPARTESYENLFGLDVPYLTGVDNVDESGFIYYKKELHYTYEELQKLLVKNGFDYSYKKDEKSFATPNKNLRSEYAVFGNVKVNASLFAEIAGLNSTFFEITQKNDGYTFSSYGYGSGLGMSQYGANVLASKGYDYKDILSFYFKGTLIEKVN